MKAVELFAGIGGFAQAFGGTILAAIDQNQTAQLTYQFNYPHPFIAKTLESISVDFLKELNADLWWASPPCQPFTIKGMQRQLKDSRSKGFLDMLHKIKQVQPRHFFFENVMGFEHTTGHRLLLDTLTTSGYRYSRTYKLCPTQWGLPNRRPRFYLAASKQPFHPFPEPISKPITLASFLRQEYDSKWLVPGEVVSKYWASMDVVDPSCQQAITQTFGSGYGKSPGRCGSYLKTFDGKIRFFTPREILNLLGFSKSFQFPPSLPIRRQWKHACNSLSIPVVKAILSTISHPQNESPAKSPKTNLTYEHSNP